MLEQLIGTGSKNHNRQVMLHLDTADGYTNSAVGSSFSPGTVYPNTTISSAQSKFTSGSLVCTATTNGGYVLNNPTPYDYTKGFTTACWFKIVPPINQYWSCLYDFEFISIDGTRQYGFFMQVNPSYQMNFQYPSNFNQANWTGAALSTNVWHHMAVTYDGYTMYIFMDGVNVLTVANRLGYRTSPIDTGYKSRLIVGNNYGLITTPTTSNTNTAVGTYINEMLLDKRCLYKANFTPPTAPYSNE